MAFTEDQPFDVRASVSAEEPIGLQLVTTTAAGATFAHEVPALLFRLQPRTLGEHSFWRLEVAVPADDTDITSGHSLVVARQPYSAVWSALARFRTGSPEPPELPSGVTSLEKAQAYVDHQLEHDPWEKGDRLVAGLSLPAAPLSSLPGTGYCFGACVDPLAIERQLLSVFRVEPVVAWTDKGYFHPAGPLDAGDAERTRHNILMQVAIRLALAGPSNMEGRDSLAVSDLAQDIYGELQSAHQADLVSLRRSLSFSQQGARHFHIDLLTALQQKQKATEGRGRLLYKTTAPGVLEAAYDTLPVAITDGQVLTQLRSLTLCATDVSNLHGVLGHGHADAQVLGHENCNLVLESKVDGIEPGSYIVPLGDDWLGLAEYEMFRPVLPEHEPESIPLSYVSRGTYLDPDSGQHIKAVCVVPEWRSGISLIEPLAHVYTYFATSADARMARTVVVLGAGACGLFFALFVRLFGAAKHIAMLDVIPGRLRFAQELGLADSAWNSSTDAAACEQLVADSKGAYADLVFDALPGRLPKGSPSTRRLAARLLRPQGEYIMYSAAEEADFPLIEWLGKGPRLHVAPYDSRVIDFTQRGQLMKRILGMIDSGLVRPGDYIARQIDFYSEADVQRLFREYGRTDEVKVEVLANRS